MKKIFLLGTLFLLLLSNTAFATNWQWVTSDAKYGWFFDTDTIHYELTQPLHSDKSTVDVTLITFWEKIVITPDGAKEFAKTMNDQRYRNAAYAKNLETISLRHKASLTRETIFYDKNGSIIYIDSGSGSFWPIIPGSYAEDMFLAVHNYARTHHAQLIRNAYSN